jgi:hypothetical protein
MRSHPILAAIPLLVACYTYAPVETAAVQPGSEVRARVSASMARELAPLLGAEPRVLNGKVIGVGDTLVLEVPSVLQAEVGSSVQTLHQRVSIPRPSLMEIETRTLDRFKTGMIAGAAGLIVGSYVLRATVLNPGKEGQPGGGGPGEFTIPIFRIRP